jgi:hypothetical protein
MVAVSKLQVLKISLVYYHIARLEFVVNTGEDGHTPGMLGFTPCPSKS